MENPKLPITLHKHPKLLSNRQPIAKDCVTNQELVSIVGRANDEIPHKDQTTGRRWYEPDLQVTQIGRWCSVADR
jgi:hypothetical protein